MAHSDKPLGLTVHSLPKPDEAGQRTTRGRWQALFVLLICAAPVIASYFTFYVIKPTGEAYGTLITPPRPMPALQGVDLDGRPVVLRDLAGQWLIVSVSDAACGADCEQRLFMQRQLREMLGRERDRVDKLWLVADDAPVAPSLRQALEATPAMHIVRVPRALLQPWLQADAVTALDQHLYVVDPLGHVMMRQPAEPDPAKVKRDLDRLLRASASWDHAGRQTLLPTDNAAAGAAALPQAGSASGAVPRP